MNFIARFVLDFLNTFACIISSGIVILVEATAQIVNTIRNFYAGIIAPFVVEIVADINFILIVMSQMIMSITSDSTLLLSQWLLKISQFSHEKSEQLIHRSWVD